MEQNISKEYLVQFRIFRKQSKIKRTKVAALVLTADIRQYVATVDEMTMAQYKIIHSHNTIVAAKFQQKTDSGGKNDGIVVIW